MRERTFDQSGFRELGKKNAVDFVEACDEANVEELKGVLSSYIRDLGQAIRHNTIELLEGFINTVYKGFRFKSEHAGAIKYFYLGYYARYQEEVLNEAKKYDVQLKINQIASKKHFEHIMQYLYINGISQQKDIAFTLQINKSNLSRILNEVTDYKLINKLVGPKNVFYELTQEGYAYCRKHKWCVDSPVSRDFWVNDTDVAWDTEVSYADLASSADDSSNYNKLLQPIPHLREYEAWETKPSEFYSSSIKKVKRPVEVEKDSYEISLIKRYLN